MLFSSGFHVITQAILCNTAFCSLHHVGEPLPERRRPGDIFVKGPTPPRPAPCARPQRLLSSYLCCYVVHRVAVHPFDLVQYFFSLSITSSDTLRLHDHSPQQTEILSHLDLNNIKHNPPTLPKVRANAPAIWSIV